MYSAVINGEERIDVSEVSRKEIDDFIDSMTNEQLQSITEFVELFPH